MIISNPPGPFEPSWERLENYVVPEWYLDAKFGIFIHWGPYSVPAFGNEWYPRNMYVQGTPEFDHHVANYGPQDKFGYKDFIPLFTAEKFSADAWCDLFQESGAKFVVPVAEHHDGFAMYKSEVSKWNSSEMGPKRDVVGELAAATRARGMVFGVSSHRIEHWWFMNGGRDFPSDVQDEEFREFYGPASSGSSDYGQNPPDEPFMEDWLRRCAELVDAYRPQLFWFDWWIEQPVMSPYLRRFASYYYNKAYAWGQGVAINYKHEAFPVKAAIYDVERGQLAEIRERYWQTDTAVAKNSWSYVEGMDYKTSASLIHDLVDIVSKNGCLLLNIGPRADGTIPDEDQAILRDIGAWLARNGEAIYGTRPWKTYGEGPTKVVEGKFQDTKRKAFTASDVRYTTKGGDLYATVLAEVEGLVKLRSLSLNSGLEPRTIASVEALGIGKVDFVRGEDALEVTLPSALPKQAALSLKITFGEQ